MVDNWFSLACLKALRLDGCPPSHFGGYFYYWARFSGCLRSNSKSNLISLKQLNPIAARERLSWVPVRVHWVVNESLLAGYSFFPCDFLAGFSPTRARLNELQVNDFCKASIDWITRNTMAGYWASIFSR